VLERDGSSEQFACANTKVWLESEVFNSIFLSAVIQFPFRFAALSQLSRSAQQALNALCMIGSVGFNSSSHALHYAAACTGKLRRQAQQSDLLRRPWLHLWRLEPEKSPGTTTYGAPPSAMQILACLGARCDCR
jgi:hypothetical protein